MIRTDYRLFAALTLSLLAHLLTFAPGLLPAAPQPAPPEPLLAELRPPPAAPPPASAPPLRLPDPPPRPEKPAAKHRPPTQAPPHSPETARTWTQSIREQLRKLDAAGQFYPAEAIARGLEGEAHVLLVIDEGGNVVATRIEQSSGHAILDEAAQRAARALKSLPADAPRQTVLPIRFRLK